MPRELLKGNVAMAEAAIRAGVEAYFGYPITPQTELLEWMSQRMPELGRAFLQAESEVAAINMVYGAACTGVRVMSSSSSPGVSLMMEGLSYIAGTEVPVVLIDVVHGGGHGDYHNIVLAPASVQEAIDLTVLAFDLAEKYRCIAMIQADGNVGQMMEPAELPPMQPLRHNYPDWSVRGAEGRERRILSSINLNPEEQEIANIRVFKRWQEIEANEIRFKEYFLDDAEVIVIGFGTAGRVAYSAVRSARAEGIKVGLMRPISISPFPFAQVKELANQARAILVVEMNTGQMLEDVRLAVAGKVPVEFYGRLGGMVPYPDEILKEIQRVAYERLPLNGDPRKSWLDRLQMEIGQV
jgi:2-oxoglutarate ferredoxin oxidoreductase subunit alpha